SLRGLRALAISIDLSEEAEMYGLMTDVLRGMIEQKLSSAGIEVRDLESITEVTGSPVLEALIRVMRLDDALDVWQYVVSLDLEEWVLLSRDDSVRVFATVWHAGLMGTSAGIGLQKLANPISSCVDQFVTEYANVNEWNEL